MCPHCRTNSLSRVLVTREILAQNRDAVFSCSGCGFRSLLVITYRPKGREYQHVRPFRQYHFLEHGERARFLLWSCSQCNGPALVRTSSQVIPSVTKCYLECRDPECGGSYVAFLEHFEQLAFTDRHLVPEVPFRSEVLDTIKQALEDRALQTRRINCEP
jgi:hypothetical protein